MSGETGDEADIDGLFQGVDIANMRAGFRSSLGDGYSQECLENLRVLALWLCQLLPAFASPVSWGIVKPRQLI